MRCRACNCVLTDFEATRKMVNTGEYPDLCNRCFRPIEDEVESIENAELLAPEDQTVSGDDQVFVSDMFKRNTDREWGDT